MFKLTKKVALVTGGADGIGRAISIVLASCGATVYVLDVNEEHALETVRLITDKSGFAFYLFCDVSDQNQVAETVRKIKERESAIDILVNNAGVAHIGTAENTSEDDFDRVYRVNVKGAYNCIHICVPYMKNSGGGVIVNMASVASGVGLPDRFAYSVSKGAVATMTYSVARDFVRDNIRCNSISPGRVNTPFVQGYLKEHYPGREAEMFEKLSKTQPIGRMAAPSEIANLALYLCSDESAFVTGSDFPIDGGFVTLNT